MTPRLLSRALWATAAGALALVTACTAAPTSGPAPTPSPSPGPSRGTGVTSTATPLEPAEPTTTNTLPPPPDPTGPAPSTAGRLDAAELPVPRGWRTVEAEGGEEEGFEGNGTWVRGRDPRYAAQDVITLGCADVTRDDYADPLAALEGRYGGPDGQPGVGLALEFAGADDAGRYWARYTDQVRACQTVDDPVRTELVDVGADARTLVDRRTYPDSTWTEVGRLSGPRITLVILGDGGLTRAVTTDLLDQLG